MKALCEAEKPLICVGGGVFAANAQPEINKLSKLMQIPVITTMMGISTFPDDDPLFCGMIGSFGIKAANAAVNECDLLFLVGARVGDRAVSTPMTLAKTTKILHIDIDPAEIGKNIGTDIPLVGDAKLVLQQLLDIAEPMKHTEWIKQLQSYRTQYQPVKTPNGTIDPKEFIMRLSDAMPANTTIVADVGQNQIWTCNNYKFKKGGRLLTTGGMGTMGYSVPAAVGAKLADPKRPTVAICGDGAFQMSMMELAVVMQEKVDIKIVVLRNNFLGLVREYQHYSLNDRYEMVKLGSYPKLDSLSAAYDLDYYRAENMDGIDELIQRFLANDGPALMEVIVDPQDTVK